MQVNMEVFSNDVESSCYERNYYVQSPFLINNLLTQIAQNLINKKLRIEIYC